VLTLQASHPALPSPDCLYIAALTETQLVVRLSRAAIDEIPIRTIDIPNDFSNRINFIRWSFDRGNGDDDSKPTQHRVLLADDHTIRIWDVVDTQWSTKIDNAGCTFGKIAQVDFGLDGNEVIVFSEFGVKLSVWTLNTGKCVEIKDPKFSHSRGFGYRPRTGHFALLTRPNAFDTLTVHAPGSHEAIASITIQTIDAQGLKWSPDGQWIAVWDSPAAGYKVAIYTADGQLYRIYNGDEEEELAGLGVKTLEWSPGSNYLAISGFDNQVTLLGAKTAGLPTYSNIPQLMRTVQPHGCLRPHLHNQRTLPSCLARTSFSI
jgi:WD40 repeat protein